MNQEQLKNILEAVLMATKEPLSTNQLISLFENEIEKPEKTELKAALEQLKQDYDGRGLELREIASGYRYQVRSEYAEWVRRLNASRPQRYSKAVLETLAIIAYRQPITRGEIENIRGVSDSSNIVRTLQEREWVRVVGHRDVPGKPELLATTKQFLDYFNLKKLSDLPPLAEIKNFEMLEPDLFDMVETAPGDKDTQVRDTEETDPITQTEQQEDEAVESIEFSADDNVIPFSGSS